MTTTAQESVVQELVAQVAPVLRTTTAQSEAGRRLAPEAMAALIDAGVFRALLPAAYGGAELSLADGLQLIEELSYLDSAAGWISAICAGTPTLLGILPKQAADEMFADQGAMLCGAWYPPGQAEPVQGGYRVSGRWSFASGSNYATWLTGQALVIENGAPKLDANGMPTALIVFFPARQAEIIENWDTLGMRGTGSHDFRIQDLFVPEHFVWTIGPWAPVNPAYSGPIHRMGAAWVPPLLAAVTLGIARAAIDDLVELAQTKTPSYTMTGLADKPVVQDKIARARALVDAASSYSERAAADAEEILQSQPGLRLDQRIPLALAGSFGIEASVQAVDLVHACAGTSGIRNEQRFQRYFRDVHTLSQHAFSSPGRYESIGKLMLGRESDWPFHYV